MDPPRNSEHENEVRERVTVLHAARPRSSSAAQCLYTWFPWLSHMCLHERYFFMLVHSSQNVSCRNKGCGWSKYLWNKTGNSVKGTRTETLESRINNRHRIAVLYLGEYLAL